MKIFFRCWMPVLLFLFSSFSFAQTEKTALLLNIKSAISPATQEYIERGLSQAAKQNAQVVILQLDTPGGLDKSMRGIISNILASPIPVIAYVAPSGARAASAGTFILYASHIAAMAPGTNLGAATPVNIAGDGSEKKEKSPDAMEKKVTQDAMAYIRSLAQLRNRNVQWAEQAVKQGASLSANEALQMKVIDVIATDIPDLLTKINNRQVSIQGQTKTLATDKLSVNEFTPDWRVKFLNIITDPNVVYILMLLGIWGLFFEFSNPGFVLPGVTGAICLLLALYGFQLLPINYVGFALIIFGIGCLIAEAFVSSFGALGIGGIIAFALGSLFLVETGAGFQIAWQLILAATLTTAAFFLLIVNIALRSRFRPVVSGREELIGQTGVVEVDANGLMRMRVKGEMWQVHAEQPLHQGTLVRVIRVDGLTLLVEPVNKNS